MSKAKFSCETCNKCYRTPSEWKRHLNAHKHKLKTDKEYADEHKQRIRKNYNARMLRYYHNKRSKRSCKLTETSGYVSVERS